MDRTYIPFDRNLWREVDLAARRFYKGISVTPCRYEDIVARYRGGKRKAYYGAMLKLRETGWRDQYAIVSMFVKPDRYPSGQCAAKDPRAIQFRSMQFNLAFGAFIKPIEDVVYHTLTYGVISNTRVIAKGLNPYERADLLLHKAGHFRKPAFVLLDHSRFDSTINVDHLRTTHRLYKSMCPSKFLARLCRAQINNVGYSKSGIKYRAKGTRMSGDADTALGNSLVNAHCLYGFVRHLDTYDFLLDGDDSVLIVEASDVARLDRGLFGRLGFDTKMQVVYDLDEVEFCQAKIVLAQRPVFMRNPTRAMSHAMVARKAYHRPMWHRWLSAVGHCERAANIGVPILQAFGDQLASLSDRPFFDDEMAYKIDLLDFKRKSQPVLADARASVAVAWGIPWDIQVLMETYPYTASAFVFSKTEKWLKQTYSRYKPVYLKYYGELADKSADIRACVESAPQSSGSGWWSSSQTGPECPGPGRI